MALGSAVAKARRPAGSLSLSGWPRPSPSGSTRGQRTRSRPHPSPPTRRHNSMPARLSTITELASALKRVKWDAWRAGPDYWTVRGHPTRTRCRPQPARGRRCLLKSTCRTRSRTEAWLGKGRALPRTGRCRGRRSIAHTREEAPRYRAGLVCARGRREERRIGVACDVDIARAVQSKRRKEVCAVAAEVGAGENGFPVSAQLRDEQAGGFVW